MGYYYLGFVEIPSALSKMEKDLSKSLRDYEYSVVAESELDKIVQKLQERQTDIANESPRLKRVSIQWVKLKYIASNAGAAIGIGRNSIQLIKINQFIGIFHEPDDPEGISSHELKHQLYGAKFQMDK